MSEFLTAVFTGFRQAIRDEDEKRIGRISFIIYSAIVLALYLCAVSLFRVLLPDLDKQSVMMGIVQAVYFFIIGWTSGACLVNIFKKRARDIIQNEGHVLLAILTLLILAVALISSMVIDSQVTPYIVIVVFVFYAVMPSNSLTQLTRGLK